MLSHFTCTYSLYRLAHPSSAAEIFQALKPAGILSITEGFLDPHHQSWEQVRHLAQAVGIVEENCASNRWLFTMNLLKPPTP